ncbi:hypothetical protein Nepgr_006570 [Nepenthes gracilis]|uniref:Uncharacterized protein n=1 Tax=Nepenthes gracilis TaxID=150966 RepID=A0AAD3S5P8_NEPGR|nr:hypothetical protein Nepgr_006570 [Nepenthes gracilis]
MMPEWCIPDAVAGKAIDVGFLASLSSPLCVIQILLVTWMYGRAVMAKLSEASIAEWIPNLGLSAYLPDCALAAPNFELCEVCEFDVCGAETDEGLLLMVIAILDALSLRHYRFEEACRAPRRLNGLGCNEPNSMLQCSRLNGSTAAAGGIGCLPAVAISWCCICRLPGTPDDTGM